MDHYIEVAFYILVFILASILTDPAVMYAGEVEVSQSDIVVATLILEAGGEYAEGAMEAVHEVILNRSAIRQMTPAEVCLQPHQFASWSVEDQLAQLNKAKSHPRWGEAFLSSHCIHKLTTPVVQITSMRITSIPTGANT